MDQGIDEELTLDAIINGKNIDVIDNVNIGVVNWKENEQHLNEDCYKNWESTGKNVYLNAIKSFFNEDSITDEDNLYNHLSCLLYYGIKGLLTVDQVISTLLEITSLSSVVHPLICDTLNLLDSLTSSTNATSEERNKFSQILIQCEQFLTEPLLKERLEIETLQEVGILPNKNFYTKFIKVKTKLYYKQKKFNLFREENEGFAKLIVELNRYNHEHDISEIIKSLIGAFSLDPNRVLDLILESFEYSTEREEFFIPLLKNFMDDPKIICEVLGSKYCYHQKDGETPTPKSLYTVTAVLMLNKIISLDDIYYWLIPGDKHMLKIVEKQIKDAKEFARKQQVISTKDKDQEEEINEVEESDLEQYSTNQKFGLCEALLNVGNWTDAKQIIKRLPDKIAIYQEPIAKALCRMINVIIDPVYRKKSKVLEQLHGKEWKPFKNKFAPKQAETFIDLRENAIPMLVLLGPYIYLDTILLNKIVRLCYIAISEHPMESAESLYYEIISILDTSLLPALSFFDCNCCLAEDIWNLIKIYPYRIRYNLYSRWKNETYQYYPKLMIKRAESYKQIKNIMKRVSKETVKQVGRLIGKLTHSSPGYLFDYILLQIQIYDNLIHPVVDSLKYLTNLSYDVLGFCLVENLTLADRNRFKHDGTSISLWLQSLASFCGAIFKKYNIELTGLLQYVANQLKAEKSLDLLILKEIVQKMAGIEAAEELTDEQLDAMAGGDLLKAEAGYFSQVRNTKRSSLRLKEAMSEQNLAVALCLLIAQQKYGVVYRETENSHLKLVGKLYDQCQDTLVQFGTFLGSTLSVDEYVNKLPTIQSMLQDYHIHTDVAFFLARPMFNHAINIKYDQLRKQDPNLKKLPTTVKQQKYYEAVKEVMAPVIDSVIPLHSSKIWEDISPQFLVTFWSLTMYDLYVPVDSYQREINKLRQMSLQATDSKDNANKGKKDQERYLTLMEKLQDEKKKQNEHVEKIMYRLKQEKDTWFLSRSAKAAKNETITQFLQLCLFPRCIFTAIDATYCAKFVHTIHKLKTENFATLLCYDRLFCDITYSITSLTENEANRYGRFLCAMLETVMRWHSNKTIYDQECANFPGFVTKYRVSNQYSENCDHVGYENYRHVCHKWHYKITKAMLICLESKDYVQIRNGLIILIKIIPHFPVLLKLAQYIEKRVDRVRIEEKNQRQDLYTLAISYAGQLKMRSGSMMREQDFHQVSEKKPETVTDIESDKSSNFELVNKDKEKSSDTIKESVPREKTIKKEKQQNDTIHIKSSPKSSPSHKESNNTSKEKISEKEKTPSSVENKEKYTKKEKEDKKEDNDKERERDREKRKERKEEKLTPKEEKQYKEERYVDMIAKEDRNVTYGAGSMSNSNNDRYYMERDRDRDRDRDHRERDRNINSNNMAPSSSNSVSSSNAFYDERDLSLAASSLSSNSNSILRHSQEPPEVERVAKRRKLDGSNSKSSKHEDNRKISSTQDAFNEVHIREKKDRTVKQKDKRDKDKAITDEERELRKERKLGRKRDRLEEPFLLEQKRRRDEEKVFKLMSSHSNGELLEPVMHSREKHHHSTREKSPYGRDRSHDRSELRDKQRSSEGKRR